MCDDEPPSPEIGVIGALLKVVQGSPNYRCHFLFKQELDCELDLFGLVPSHPELEMEEPYLQKVQILTASPYC